jgi:hypothetical protein
VINKDLAVIDRARQIFAEEYHGRISDNLADQLDHIANDIAQLRSVTSQMTSPAVPQGLLEKLKSLSFSSLRPQGPDVGAKAVYLGLHAFVHATATAAAAKAEPGAAFADYLAETVFVLTRAVIELYDPTVDARAAGNTFINFTSHELVGLIPAFASLKTPIWEDWESAKPWLISLVAANATYVAPAGHAVAHGLVHGISAAGNALSKWWGTTAAAVDPDVELAVVDSTSTVDAPPPPPPPPPIEKPIPQPHDTVHHDTVDTDGSDDEKTEEWFDAPESPDDALPAPHGGGAALTGDSLAWPAGLPPAATLTAPMPLTVHTHAGSDVEDVPKDTAGQAEPMTTPPATTVTTPLPDGAADTNDSDDERVEEWFDAETELVPQGGHAGLTGDAPEVVVDATQGAVFTIATVPAPPRHLWAPRSSSDSDYDTPDYDTADYDTVGSGDANLVDA